MVVDEDTETAVIEETETVTAVIGETETETAVIGETETETAVIGETETETAVIGETETETAVIEETETETAVIETAEETNFAEATANDITTSSTSGPEIEDSIFKEILSEAVSILARTLTTFTSSTLTETGMLSTTESFITSERVSDSFDSNDDDNTNIGAVVGGAIGGLVLIVGAFLLFLVYRRRRQKHAMTAAAEGRSNMGNDKILGAPDDTGFPQLQFQPMRMTTAPSMPAEVPAQHGVSQLHEYSARVPNVGE